MRGKRIHILGSNLDTLTMEETIQQVEVIIANKKPTQHVVINASKINLMDKNHFLQNIVNESPLINADGKSIVWAARFLGYDVPGRVTGIDLFQEIVKKAEKKNWRLYYLGASKEIVDQVVCIHKKLYPDLNIVGSHNGYFKETDSDRIVSDIYERNVDVLFVAISSPKKEYWIHKNKNVLQVPFIMGVGGSFDVIAGKTKRAPKWMQDAGLEWFYRFIQEPKRMFHRYIVGNFVFIIHVFKEKLVGKWS